MTMQNLVAFVHSLDRMPEEWRALIRLLFFNPQDAAEGVFERIGETDLDYSELNKIIETAKEFGIENADVISDKFLAFCNREDIDAKDACPTCGNRPGDGRGCNDPEGCGFGVSGADFDGTEDLNDARISKPHLFDA
jgi:hypothetical protein